MSPSAGASAPGDDVHLLEHATGVRTPIHTGFLNVVRDQVRLPDGQVATREFILHAGAVAVVPLLDDGRLAMVRQYRYPVGKVLLEFPAGRRDPGESHWQTARRELLEETGFVAREWAFGLEIHNAAAYSDESIWIWFARGLVAGPQKLDSDEFVEVVHHTETELDAMAANGQLPDVKTLVALQHLQRWRQGARRLDWQAAPA